MSNSDKRQTTATPPAQGGAASAGTPAAQAKPAQGTATSPATGSTNGASTSSSTAAATPSTGSAGVTAAGTAATLANEGSTPAGSGPAAGEPAEDEADPLLYFVVTGPISSFKTVAKTEAFLNGSDAPSEYTVIRGRAAPTKRRVSLRNT